MGLTETEQRFQREKQRILEQIEKDREVHKLLREKSWARPPQESFQEEFRKLLGHSSTQRFGEAAIHIAARNQERFCKLNGIEMLKPSLKPKPKPTMKATVVKDSVVIIHLNEVLNAPRLDERVPEIRQMLTEVLQCIKDVARSCFFFSELRNYEQPHVSYYSDDDDGLNLDGYDFGKDPLARLVRGEGSLASGDSKFYRERAYRYREAAARYHTDQILFQGIPRSVLFSSNVIRAPVQGVGSRDEKTARRLGSSDQGSPSSQNQTPPHSCQVKAVALWYVN